ncbi:hypothetical protein SRHO_G00267140 [Serrasalmus rhombeus]
MTTHRRRVTGLAFSSHSSPLLASVSDDCSVAVVNAQLREIYRDVRHQDFVRGGVLGSRRLRCSDHSWVGPPGSAAQHGPENYCINKHSAYIRPPSVHCVALCLHVGSRCMTQRGGDRNVRPLLQFPNFCCRLWQ